MKRALETDRKKQEVPTPPAQAPANDAEVPPRPTKRVVFERLPDPPAEAPAKLATTPLVKEDAVPTRPSLRWITDGDDDRPLSENFRMDDVGEETKFITFNFRKLKLAGVPIPRIKPANPDEPELSAIAKILKVANAKNNKKINFDELEDAILDEYDKNEKRRKEEQAEWMRQIEAGEWEGFGARYGKDPDPELSDFIDEDDELGGKVYAPVRDGFYINSGPVEYDWFSVEVSSEDDDDDDDDDEGDIVGVGEDGEVEIDLESEQRRPKKRAAPMAIDTETQAQIDALKNAYDALTEKQQRNWGLLPPSFKSLFQRAVDNVFERRGLVFLKKDFVKNVAAMMDYAERTLRDKVNAYLKLTGRFNGPVVVDVPDEDGEEEEKNAKDDDYVRNQMNELLAERVPDAARKGNDEQEEEEEEDDASLGAELDIPSDDDAPRQAVDLNSSGDEDEDEDDAKGTGTGERACHWCAADATLYCKKCETAVYCSQKCASTAWRVGRHYLDCNTF